MASYMSQDSGPSTVSGATGGTASGVPASGPAQTNAARGSDASVPAMGADLQQEILLQFLEMQSIIAAQSDKLQVLQSSLDQSQQAQEEWPDQKLCSNQDQHKFDVLKDVLWALSCLEPGLLEDEFYAAWDAIMEWAEV